MNCAYVPVRYAKLKSHKGKLFTGSSSTLNESERFDFPPRKLSGGPSGTADMTDSNDAPNVKIIPPLVYLAGIVIGFLTTIWMPTKIFTNSVAWRGLRS